MDDAKDILGRGLAVVPKDPALWGQRQPAEKESK